MSETSLQDTIEREMIIRAPIEKVYAAIADPAQLGKWFARGVEGTLEAGERPVFDFGKYGRFRVYVVAAEPPRYFAYRWTPGSSYVPDGFFGDVLTVPNTLVEFFFEAVPEGTRLRLVESGFAALPPEIYAKSLEENTEGWDEELANLERFVTA